MLLVCGREPTAAAVPDQLPLEPSSTELLNLPSPPGVHTSPAARYFLARPPPFTQLSHAPSPSSPLPLWQDPPSPGLRCKPWRLLRALRPFFALLMPLLSSALALSGLPSAGSCCLRDS